MSTFSAHRRGWNLEGGNFFNLCILDKLYVNVAMSLAFIMAKVTIPYPGHQTLKM